MVRGARKQLAPLLSALSSSFASTQGSTAAYAVPALAGSTLPRSSYGRRVSVPLSEPLGDVDIPKYIQPKAPELQTGSIGAVKAATLDAPGPNSTVAVFVGAGSSSETQHTAGAAKVLEYLAFNATNNRSTFRVTRELEKYGTVFTAVAGREHISYTVESTKVETAEVTEVLLDAVLNQRLNDWEVRDMLHRVEQDVEAAYRRPMIAVSEMLHRAAFSGGLSRPLIPDAPTVSRLTGAALREFHAQHFTPANMVIAGAGVDMRALGHVAEPLLTAGGGAAGQPHQAPQSSYTGGAMNVLIPGVRPTVALAFEVKGGLGDPKAAALAAVLKALLHETREPLPKMHKAPDAGLASLKPIAHLYKSSGLVGLAAGCEAGGASKALDALTAKLQALSKASDADVAAAKGVALGGYQSAIAAAPGMVQDMGLQLLARGKFSASEAAAAVAGLTAGDVKKGVEAMLKGAPTVVAAGALSDIPKYDPVAKRFS